MKKTFYSDNIKNSEFKIGLIWIHSFGLQFSKTYAYLYTYDINVALKLNALDNKCRIREIYDGRDWACITDSNYETLLKQYHGVTDETLKQICKRDP